MQRILKFVFFLFVLFLVYQFVVIIFVDRHTSSYQIESNDKTFLIQEAYTQNDKKHDYYFEINVDDHHFAFHNTSDLNKKKQVIEKIEYFESGDWSCIYPILVKGKSNYQTDIICNQNGALYTYSYLKQQNNTIVNAFVQHLQQLEYTSESWNQIDKKETFSKLSIYPENLLFDYFITVWNYRGVEVINRDSRHTFSLLKQDRYENTHSRLIGKYYILPDYDQPYDFTDWKVLDIIDWKEKTISMDDSVSFDSYINGVVKNELYFFDKSSKKQYAINPSTKAVREVGNLELDGQYYQNGSWETRNIYDFISQELIFQGDITLEELSKQYGNIEIKKSNGQYYFKTEDGKVYMTFLDHLDQVILLFQDSNIVDWKVVDNVVYFLSGTTIYQYDDYTGLRPIIESNEFKYNYKNIFEVYKK